VGRCGECQAWGTVAEVTGARKMAPAGVVAEAPRPITEFSAEPAGTRSTGVGELDRVLGGGIVEGAAVLLAGEPGVGKSTLLLEVAAQCARAEAVALYVCGEESTSQVRLRADRTGAVCDRLLVSAETDLHAVLDHVDQVRPDLVIIDSIQSIASADVDGPTGGVAQVREVTAALVRIAKQRGVAMILVGHVTKEGSIAGPRVVEHLVDVVLQFEGEPSSRLRVLRATKNRFGPIDEVGCFDLSDEGIVEIVDPTGLFVSRHAEPVPGTCVTVTRQGRRPLLAEVQALVSMSTSMSPRRTTSGLDSARVNLVLAVLERRAGLRLSGADIFVATVGGARLTDPSADLATAIAIASAVGNRVVPQSLVALGEVGLAGELRRVPGLQHRLAEAARLGFGHALVPADLGPVPASSLRFPGLTVLDVPDLGGALGVLGLIGAVAKPVGPRRLRVVDA
jgi:DNA repair protein RadA/Sms